MCIHSFLQFRTGVGLGGITPLGSLEEGNFRLRGSGIFNDPNDFAMVFVFCLPVGFSLLRQRGSIFGKFFLLCWMPAAIGALYFTQSRGGVFGFCVMLLAYMWSAGRVTVWRIILSVILLSSAVVLRPSRARESVYEESAAGRIVEWGMANQFLKQNPFFGIGYNRWLDYEALVTHNSFVTCYAELGLVGYFFWFALLWLVLKKLLIIARAGSTLAPEIGKLAGGLFAGTVGFFTAAFFLTRTYITVLYLIWGLGVGLIRVAMSDSRFLGVALPITKRDLRQSLIFCILSIPAIWLSARLFWLGSGG
jgi:O-antigen ligase